MRSVEPGEQVVLAALRSVPRSALAAREDPRAFLGNAAVFGELGGDARFSAAFARQLSALWSDGVEATLRAYVG